ncbi:helicase [Vibrio phage 3.058.O._10N.286.46.B8]|nr:helicase [Vibrio phage 2.058.O._10N.286.46.B8]AUS03166.1 helicase [Vibrio phage 3.058.O._10N.286.46.B8]
MDVIFRKVDNVYGQVECEDYDFIIMLRDYFSFFAEGYQFHPSYKNRMWDGKIRLLNAADGKIYLGLWESLKDFCERHNKVCHVDPRISTKPLPKERFTSFVKSLNVHTDGEAITPYDYQQDAAHYALEYQKSLLLSPTSSGKSLIQYMLLRMYLMILPEDEQILIIVPKSGLVKQMIGDFKDYSSANGWDVDKFIYTINGTCKETKKRITITTYQSLTNPKTKPPREWFNRFGAVMVDEVHTATAKSVMYILESCASANWKVGLTGTLDGSKTNEMTLRGLFGPVKNVITTKELMDRGTVAQLTVKVGLLKHPEKYCKLLRSADRGDKDPKTGKPKKRKATYAEEIKYITESVERNRFVMRFTAGLKGNTILMINMIEHGEILYKWMKEALPDRKIYLYTGATGINERETIRQLMEKQDGAIIIGSLGVLSTGISIKRLHNLVFAHPSKSRIKVLQTVGRLLRKSKFGNEVTMFDLVDSMEIGSYSNYTLEHGRIRTKYYHDQLFETEMVSINL